LETEIKLKVFLVGFEVLTAVSTKMAVFWVVLLIALMMEAARTSETLVNFYQATRRYNPEDSHLRHWMEVNTELHASATFRNTRIILKSDGEEKNSCLYRN
jgi:hypothetical protein